MLDRLFAVIPAFNEASSIYSIVTQTLKHTQQVVVVNDGSTDQTQYLAHQAGAVVINTPERVGYSKAVLTGLVFAAEQGCTDVITIDADGAHVPDEIPNLLAPHICFDANLTIGNRFKKGTTQHIPSTKVWSNFLASTLARYVMDVPLDDVACGFRVLGIEFINELLKVPAPRGYGLPYSMITVAKKKGFKICSTSVSVRYNADSVLCTARGEFLDFLAALSTGQAIDSALGDSLSRLREVVCNLKPAVIRIGGVFLFLHPLEAENGYLFQAQDSAFEENLKSEQFNFDLLNDLLQLN
jgi:glycosyltransferase involved in cell wall biosynthesis